MCHLSSAEASKYIMGGQRHNNRHQQFFGEAEDKFSQDCMHTVITRNTSKPILHLYCHHCQQHRKLHRKVQAAGGQLWVYVDMWETVSPSVFAGIDKTA